MMGRNARSFFWNLSENLATQLIQFTIGIIMARILMPADYGLVGILYVYTAICTTVTNGGFSAALIQNTERNESDYSTVFFFNMGVSVALALLLWTLSPLLASFYGQPLLEGLTKVMALPIVINALNLVQRTRLTIQLDFKLLAKIGVVAAVVQGTTGVAMAYSGCGVWSIAWAQVAGAATSCLLCWLWSGWRPQSRFSAPAFKRMFSYGSKLLTSSLIDTVWNNIYPLIIGKFYPPASLGFFTRAHGYAALPATTITDVVSRVTFPILSEMQAGRQQLHQSYNQMLLLTAFFMFPLMVGIATLADPLIRLMLTDKWVGCVPYLQILCLAMMLYPVHALNLTLLKVTGRSDLFLRLELWKKGLGIIVLAATLPLGVKAMCWGMLLLSVVSLLFNTHYTGKFLQLGIFAQIKFCLPIAGIAALSAACAYGTTRLTTELWLQLLGGAMAGAIAYCLFSRLLTPSAFKTVVETVRNRRSAA